MAEYAIKKVVKLGYEEALAKIPALLKEEGFGILTEIDVKETLKKKLNVDFQRYKILGACNPPFAHQALSADLDIGVMLPCNVVVYEGKDGQTQVSAINPAFTIERAGNPKLTKLTRQVSQKLAQVLEKL